MLLLIVLVNGVLDRIDHFFMNDWRQAVGSFNLTYAMTCPFDESHKLLESHHGSEDPGVILYAKNVYKDKTYEISLVELKSDSPDEQLYWTREKSDQEKIE